MPFLFSHLAQLFHTAMSTDSSNTQNQPVPAPTDRDTENQPGLPPTTVAGTTTANKEIWHFYIDMVEGQIKEEQNLARRQNAEVCLEFVKQHGYPAIGYRFLIHHGIMEVLTQDEYPYRDDEHLRQIGSFKDAYGLVCCCPIQVSNPKHSSNSIQFPHRMARPTETE